MRNTLLAGAAALGLIILTPAPARADLSFGELEDALTDFGEDMFTILVEILLAPAELPDSFEWVIPETVVGNNYSGLPTTVEETAEYAIDRVTDRIARVDGINGVVGTAIDQALNQIGQMVTLAVANAATPYSIASLQQIGNAAQIANTSTNAALVQHMGAQMALDADRAYQEEATRITAMVQQQAWAMPVVGGGVEAATFELPW